MMGKGFSPNFLRNQCYFPWLDVSSLMIANLFGHTFSSSSSCLIVKVLRTLNLVVKRKERKKERKKEKTFLDFTSFVCHYDNFCGWSQTCRISDLKRYLLRKRKTIHWSNGLAFLFAYSCGIRTNWTERNRVWFCFSRMNLFKWQYQKAKLN